MSIRSITAVLLGCALLSGAASAAPPAHSQSKAENKKDKAPAPTPSGNVDSANSPDATQQQCLDSGGTWTAGVCITAERQCLDSGGVWVSGICGTAPPATPAATLQQLTCLLYLPPQGVVTAGPMLVEIRNSTPNSIPADTVIWMGPPNPTTVNGITMPYRGLNPDGTLGHMDRYLKLAAELPAGGFLRPQYSPSPAWPGCAAVVGMTYLISEVSFVE